MHHVRERERERERELRSPEKDSDSGNLSWGCGSPEKDCLLSFLAYSYPINKTLKSNLFWECILSDFKVWCLLN